MVNVKGQVEFPPSPGTLTFYIVRQSSIMVSFISDKKPAGIVIGKPGKEPFITLNNAKINVLSVVWSVYINNNHKML